MKRVLHLILFLPIVLALAGCTAMEGRDGQSLPIAQDIPKPSPPSDTSTKTQDWEWQITKEEKEEGAKEVSSKPAEFTMPMELRAPELVLPTPEGKKLDVSMTFHSADVREVLKMLLGELLDVNYVIDKKVGGEVTFRMVGQFYKEEMLNIIQAVLNVQNLAMVQKNGIIEVTLLGEAKMEPGPLSFGKKIERRGANIVTQVIPLHYTTPQALIPTIRAFMTPAGIVMAPNNSHAIVIVDKASNVRRLVAIIDTFDIPSFAGKAVKFYDIENVNVSNLAKDLESLTRGLGQQTKGPEQQLGFIPLTDTNKLLVTAATPKMLPTIDFWIKHMDIKPSEGLQIYIYKLQHKKAESMAMILNDLFAKGGAVGPTATTELEAPPQAGPQVTAGSTSQAGPVKVIADAESNALVISAVPKDYQNIRRIIDVMDATPKQVLIEVLIAEVTLTDAFAYGVEYFLRSTGTKDGIGTSILPNPADAIVGRASEALLFAQGTRIFHLRKNLDAVLTVLDQTTNVEILATPRILVRHEQKATIQVGQEEPILTQRLQEPAPAQPGDFVTSNTIEYRDTGTILHVTPRIGENNMVTLDIDQEVTSIQDEVTRGIDSPRFATRKAVTSLVVENGRTIVIGGIIETKYVNVVGKIPVLHLIPLLGNLFKSQDISKKKTELLLVLTPYVVSNSNEADKITQDFERKLKAIGKLRSKKTTNKNVSVQ